MAIKLRNIKSAIHDFVNSAIEKAYDMAQEQKNLYASPILNFTKGFDVDAEKKQFVEFTHKNGFCKELNVPEGIQTIGISAFADSKRLEDVTLPDSVVNIRDGAFQNCEKLKYVTLPEPKPNEFDGKEEGIRTIGESTFENCKELQLVNLPATITKIEDNAFRGCENLTCISGDISKMKNLTEIGDNAFKNCLKLTEMKLPDSVRTIGAGAFQNCTELKRLTLPKDLVGIEANTFENCKSLTKVNIPENVQYIEPNAFKNCENLKEITVSADLNLNADSFSRCPNLEEINVRTNNGTLHFHLETRLAEKTFQSAINEVNQAMEVMRQPDVKLEEFLNHESGNTYIQTVVALNNLDNPKAQEFVQEHIAEALVYCKENSSIELLNTLKDNFEYTMEDVEIALEILPYKPEVHFDIEQQGFVSPTIDVQETLWDMKISAPSREDVEKETPEIEMV